MAITLNFQGIEVTCDKPEEAMVLAGAAANFKPPKIADLAKLSDRPVKLKLSNGTEMTCENPAAAAATLVIAGAIKTPKIFSKEAKGAQQSGPRRAWQVSEEYAEKHGITRDEARRLIAGKVREYKAKLAVGKPTKQDEEFVKELRSLPTGSDYIENALKK